MSRVLIISCICLILFETVNSACTKKNKQDLTDEAKLYKDLTCDYNTDYRPVTDHKKTVDVKVRFSIKYMSFDALEETFTLHSWVALVWKDEFLSWDPNDYSQIKEIQMESHMIWTPKLALFNADATLYTSDTFYTTCLVSSDGTVTCVPHLSHSGICRTSLLLWPYDKENCTLYFGSWMHTGEQVNFTFYKTMPVSTDEYQDGPGWKLLKVYNEWLPGKFACCPNNTYPMLKYTFRLEREAAGPAAIIIIPCAVIVLITATSLLLDIKNNTRLLLSCFSLFSHFTYLSEIGYNLPKHGSQTPVILLFIRDSMVITFVVIVTTILLMWMRKRKAPPVVLLQRLARLTKIGPGKYMVFTEFDPTVELEPITSSDEQEASENEWILLANLFNSALIIIISLAYIILLIKYIPCEG